MLGNIGEKERWGATVGDGIHRNEVRWSGMNGIEEQDTATRSGKEATRNRAPRTPVERVVSRSTGSRQHIPGRRSGRS